MSDALLLTLLGGAARGVETYRVEDRKIPTLRQFQLLVQTAQRAVEEGLVEAHFSARSRGKHTAGMIRSFDIVAITGAGLDWLALLQARRTEISTAMFTTATAESLPA